MRRDTALREEANQFIQFHRSMHSIVTEVDGDSYKIASEAKHISLIAEPTCFEVRSQARRVIKILRERKARKVIVETLERVKRRKRRLNAATKIGSCLRIISNLRSPRQR